MKESALLCNWKVSLLKVLGCASSPFLSRQGQTWSFVLKRLQSMKQGLRLVLAAVGTYAVLATESNPVVELGDGNFTASVSEGLWMVKFTAPVRAAGCCWRAMWHAHLAPSRPSSVVWALQAPCSRVCGCSG